MGAARDIHSVRRIEKAKQRSRANQMAYYDIDQILMEEEKVRSAAERRPRQRSRPLAVDEERNVDDV